MKDIIYKIVFVVFCFFGFSAISVHASETNVGLVDYYPYNNSNGYVINGTEKPTNVWNLSTSGAYEFSGLSVYHTLYTNNLLTGATAMKISVIVPDGTDYFEGFTGKMTLYKKGLIDTKVRTFYVADGSCHVEEVRNLNANSKYYIKFDNPIELQDGRVWAV